ncbi:MAG: patatin-like phospholipase family protein [Methylocystis sp.]
MKEIEASLIREAKVAGVPYGGVLPHAQFLSVSGGGDGGAFGAGLLVGWTAHGDRPKFKIVTGVSTGALIAPFAFLGSKYDDKLMDAYTNITPEKVTDTRFAPVAALTQDALADTTPLFETISRWVDEQMLADIAAEYRKGRLLLIQTTDLDAGHAVRWNIGAIAASGNPDAPDLVRRILLASAAVPAAFPPVLFNVNAKGKEYQELHVDGGAVSQAFLFPADIDIMRLRKEAGYRRASADAYVIRNARLHAEFSDVDRLTLPIAEKAVSVLINSNGVGDLFRIYTLTKRAGVGFNVAYIGDDFQADHPQEFDQNYMRKLYRYAYDKGAQGYVWRHLPPGIAEKHK